MDSSGSAVESKMPTTMDKKGTRGRRKRGINSGMCCIRMTLITFNLATGLTGVCVMAIGLMLLSSVIQGTLSSYNDPGNTQMNGGGGGGMGGNHTNDVTVSFIGAPGSHSVDQIPETNHQHQGENPKGREFTTFILLCITFGTLMAFISFLGCFGACISSSCLLMTYVFAVVATIVFQLCISIFAIVYREPVSNYIREELLATLKKEYQPDNITMQTWDTFHTRFGCCGVDGFSDWFDADSQIVPDSCCLNIQPDCGRILDPALWQKKGCLSKIQHFVFEQLHILAFFIVGIVFLQLYGIIASTLLFYHIKTPKGPQHFQAYRYERANNM